MSADVSEVATQLSLTVPKGWRLVALDQMFAETVPDLMIAVLGDELDAETQGALIEEFGRVRNEIRTEHIAFMALRFSDEGARRDVMTVAVHGVGTPVSAEPAGQNGAPEEPADDRGERVSMAGREAIVHRSPEPDPADPDLDSSGSWVQVVVLLSGEEGAVVTVVSSAAGQEDALRGEATEVAASLALVPADSEGSSG